MVVSVHVRCKSMKYSGSEGVQHKESQSGSKFSGRRNESPNAFAVCERTVDGEKKNRSDTPIVVPVKIVIFISQRRDTCREREREEKKSIFVVLLDFVQKRVEKIRNILRKKERKNS